MNIADPEQWSLKYSLYHGDKEQPSSTLSWGPSEELLIGDSKLRLYNTADNGSLVWNRELSSPVVHAKLSPEASLIASCGRYDRLVKIWRRLSFGSEDVEFETGYVAHPAAVTDLGWCRPQEGRHGAGHMLYTICVDGKVRIWRNLDPHGLQVLQLWTEINLQESVQSDHFQQPTSPSQSYVVFFVDGADFKAAIENARRDSEATPALEHFTEVCEGNPEICVVLSDTGHMCAWGLPRLDDRTEDFPKVFNIAYVKNFHLNTPTTSSRRSQYLRIASFPNQESSSVYSVLMHRFDGQIDWFEGEMTGFFEPTPRKKRMQIRAIWTGHESPIKKIIRTIDGRNVVSRTSANQAMVWRQIQQDNGTRLDRCSTFDSDEHIHRSCLLPGGKYLVNLHHTSMHLWNTSISRAFEISSCDFQSQGKPLCLLLLPSPIESSIQYLATISSDMQGIVWQIDLNRLERSDGSSKETCSIMEEFSRFGLGSRGDLAFIIPIDPAGSKPTASSFLDTFSKDVALSYTGNGTISTWAAKLDPMNKSVGWLATATINTGIIEPSLASGSSIRKVALVNAAKNGLTIWDTRSSQLEYQKDFGEGYTIQDLDWTSTPDDQSILAVGFPHKLVILAQIRYDYLDKRPAWAPIREIHTRESTPHPIGDSTWLSNGSLVIGAGNQLFVHDKAARASDDTVQDLAVPVHTHSSLDIFDTVSLLNGPLPVFHPQFLSQCILAGKLPQVQRVITTLNKTLKFFSEGEDLDSTLSLAIEDFVYRHAVSLRPSLLLSRVANMHRMVLLRKIWKTATRRFVTIIPKTQTQSQSQKKLLSCLMKILPKSRCHICPAKNRSTW